MMLHESKSQDQEEIVFATTTKNSFSSKQASSSRAKAQTWAEQDKPAHMGARDGDGS